MELISEESADGLVFRLSGEIDLSQARELSESILRVLAAGRDLVVELSDVSYIDRHHVVTCPSQRTWITLRWVT